MHTKQLKIIFRSGEHEIQSSKDKSTKRKILYNDHFIGMPFTVSDDGVEANESGKKIVKAGTILPANDKTAKGVLLHDVDVTSGKAPGTIVIHGFIDDAKLISSDIEITPEALGVLTQITFIGCETEPTYNPTVPE